MKKRSINRLRFFLYATGGIYGFYWLLTVAEELDEEGVASSPPLMQRRMWLMIFFFTPLIVVASIYNFFYPDYGNDIYVFGESLLLISIPILAVVYAMYTVRNAIYDFVGENPSLFQEIRDSILSFQCIILLWQEKINETLP